MNVLNDFLKNDIKHEYRTQKIIIYLWSIL